MVAIGQTKDTAALMQAWSVEADAIVSDDTPEIEATPEKEKETEKEKEKELEKVDDKNDNNNHNYKNENEQVAEEEKKNENENENETEKNEDSDVAINISTDDEELVIKLSQIIPNYKQWLKENVREVYCAVDLLTQTFEVELECHLLLRQPQLDKYIKEDQKWKLYDYQCSIPIDLDDPFDGDLASEWIEQEYDYDHETGVVDMLLHMKDQFAADRQFLNIKIMGRAGDEEGNWIWISAEHDEVPDWVPEEYHGRKQLQARLGPAVADYIIILWKIHGQILIFYKHQRLDMNIV